MRKLLALILVMGLALPSGFGATSGVERAGGSSGGSGDVVGPASATDNAIARYDSTTGKLLQDSSLTLNDSGTTLTTGSSQLSTWDETNLNVGFGPLSLDSLTLGSGKSNMAFGYAAGSAITTGDNNVAFGDRALSLVTTASANTAVGYQALRNNTGSNNTAFGDGGLYSNTTGSGNLGVGLQAGHHSRTGTFNIFIGDDAQNDDGSNGGSGSTVESVAIGYQALVNRNNSFVFGSSKAAREINVGINTPEPQYKITLPGHNDNTIGNSRTYASATAGKSLTLLAGAPQVVGVITALSSTPTDGGSGYTLYDEITISTGDGTATAWVDAVSGGAVTQLLLIKPGTGYSVGTAQATSGGTGTGLTVNITSVTAAPTDLAGGDLNLSSGTSTGTGTSDIVFKTATAGSTGSSDNAPTEKWRVLGSGVLRGGGTTGIALSAASGILTIAGVGNTNNENITIDFEAAANAVAVASGTGVTQISWSQNLKLSGILGVGATPSTGVAINTLLSASNATAVKGVLSSITNSNNTATANAYSGDFTSTKSGTTGGNTGTLIGVKGLAQYSSTGTQVDAMGIYGDCQKITSGSGVISDCFSIYGATPSASGGGTITRGWSGGFDGAVRIGGSGGVKESAATGKITWTGIGNTNNEDLALDLETTANTAIFSSSTGVTAVRFPGYQSSDGTVGVTVTTCTGFKNGLCISGT